ncbi:MAG: hypothetical protein IKM94_04245, partial [Alphaproteobacteria bacterium]|nr:hypothetical protein [Alphaproteobacteria bacterium]
MEKRRGFPPVYKIERVEKMSAKRVFFGVFQKIMVICCAIFFGFANAFSANLPAGYTELEYIRTNHNAYIMTNFTVNDFDRVVADIKLYDYDTEVSSSGQYPHLFGVSANATSGSVHAKVFRFFNQTNSSMYAAYNDKWASTWGGTWAPQPVPLNDWHNFDVKLATGEQYIKMDGGIVASGTMSAQLVNSYTLPIFAMNYAGNIRYIPHLDSKAIKMYLGDTLVANFVPAKNSSGVVGLYDTVNNRFYTNAGTGEFTAGPVVRIRIATTAYNAARFSPVQTDLNNAVATIREIVTKTINQTAAIASLQADKQTRP